MPNVLAFPMRADDASRMLRNATVREYEIELLGEDTASLIVSLTEREADLMQRIMAGLNQSASQGCYAPTMRVTELAVKV